MILKNMKKLLLLIIFLIILFAIFFISQDIQASKFHEGLVQTGVLTDLARTSQSSPAIFAANIVKTLLTLVGIVFVVLIIYGGFTYMTAAGADEKVKKAKSILKNSVIGIIIITMGYTITFFISSTLESPGQTTPSYREECENSGSLDYYSINCCEYRYLVYDIIDATCCDQTGFYDNHVEGCGINMPPAL